MKHVVMGLILVVTPFAGIAGVTGDVATYGYAQLTAEPISGDQNRNGLAFGADRVRLGVRYSDSNWFGAGELDFNAGDISLQLPGTLPNLVTDLYVGYRMHPLIQFQLGQFKVPVGMDFSVPGSDLDTVKRGIDRALVLDRSLGIMASGRDLFGGFGYDLGIFNLAGRSVATDHTAAQVGDINVIASRVLYDSPARNLHLEASLGYSPEAGGQPGTRNYVVADVGAWVSSGPYSLKGEYILGQNIRGGLSTPGVDGQNQQVLFLHAGYQWRPKIELIGRVYLASSEQNGVTSTLQNTYMGANFYLGKNQRHKRLQIQYILASGDTDQWSGVGGFLSGSLLLQFQIGFEGLSPGVTKTQASGPCPTTAATPTCAKLPPDDSLSPAPQ